jgi:thiosulfate dehydrogenase (quinone) large subunit
VRRQPEERPAASVGVGALRVGALSEARASPAPRAARAARWPFLDKAFGLGHETASADAWISGGNPTEGFLSHSAGPFSSIYPSMAGAGVVNALFMTDLLAIGVALLQGIAMRRACIAGATLLMLMWTASLPPENNLFMDDRIIYALVLIGLAAVGAGKTLGLGGWWARTPVVQRHSWLA